MSNKYRRIVLILKLAIILLIPTLFFSYIGHDPLREANNNSRNVAIVNEDSGFEFENNPLNLGMEVTEVVGKDSSYQWVTVNRSTAENGLSTGQYEAIVYLPSNFTENVLSFTDAQPTEANVTYKIQPNINAQRAEKVLKELESVKNKMNTNMSTIYWNYVSQSVEDIREKFDGVLEKEVAFQNAMYEFYSPTSASLTVDIGNQKQLLEGILSTSGTVYQTTEETLGSATTNKSTIETFLSDIQAFKEYQLNQQTLIENSTAENQNLLRESVLAYDSVIKEGVSKITSTIVDDLEDSQEEGQQLYKDVVTIQNQLANGNEALEQLTKTLNSSNTTEQFDRLLQLQRDNMQLFKVQTIEASLNKLQPSLISSREKLLSYSSPEGEFILPEYTSSTLSINELKSKMVDLEAAVKSIQGTNPTLFEQMNLLLTELKNQLQSLEQQIEQQKSTQQQWITEVSKAIESEAGKNDAAAILAESIQLKEQQLLQLNGLSENRKQILTAHFSKAINSLNLNDLLQYYNLLVMYEGQVYYIATDDKAVIEDIIKNVNDSNVIWSAFNQIKAETQLFYQLHGTLNDSLANINHLEDDFFNYTRDVFRTVETFKSQFEQYQNTILNQLSSMEESVAAISENLVQETEAPTFELAPESNVQGEFLVQIHDQSFTILQTISQMVNGIVNQQDTITARTDDLYSSVSAVQAKVDDLNDRWSQNVDTTQKVKDDVYSILSNTLVDEQENPFMYHFLSNPVKVSGEAFKEKVYPEPPVIVLVIILICSLLIGLFLHQYAGFNMWMHLLLFMLITITVGLVISIYGLNIYTMNDAQAVKWTILTVLLIMALVSVLRIAFFISSFIGSLMTVLFIVFFTTPLLDLTLPNFSMKNPIAHVFLNIQLGDDGGLNLMLIILALLTILCSSVLYFRPNKSESSEQSAHEA